MQALTQDKVDILQRLNREYPISFEELDACYKSCFQREGAYGSSRPPSPSSVVDLPNPDAPEFANKTPITEDEAVQLQADFTKLSRRLIDPGDEAPAPRTKFTRKELEQRVETTKQMIENPPRKDKGILARVVGTIAEVVVKLPFMTTVVQAMIHALFCGMICAQYSYKDKRGLAMSAIAFVMGFVGAIVTKYFYVVPFFTKYVRNILKYFESWPIMGVLVTMLRTFLNYVDFLASSGCFSQLLLAIGKLAKGKAFFDKYKIGGVSATEFMTTGLTGAMFTVGMNLLHKALIKALSPYFSKVAVFFGGHQMALMIEAFADAKLAYLNDDQKARAAAMAKAQSFGWTIVTACLSSFCPDEYGPESCKVMSAILSYHGAANAILAIKEFYNQNRCVRVIGAKEGKCIVERPPDADHPEPWDEKGLTPFFVAWNMESPPPDSFPAGLVACLKALSCVSIDWAFKHPKFQTLDGSFIPKKVGELMGRPLDALQRAVGAAAPREKLGRAADAVTGAAADLIQGGARQLDDALSPIAESEEMSAADTNKDGYVSKEEYEAYTKTNNNVPEFKDLDTNGDGFVKVSPSNRRFSNMVSGVSGTSLGKRGAAADREMVDSAQFKSETSEIRNLRDNKELLSKLNDAGFKVTTNDLLKYAEGDKVLDAEELRKMLQAKDPELYDKFSTQDTTVQSVADGAPVSSPMSRFISSFGKDGSKVWDTEDRDRDARLNRFAQETANGAESVTKDQLWQKASEAESAGKITSKDVDALEDYLKAHSPNDDTINVRDYDKLGQNAQYISDKAVSAYDAATSLPSKAVGYAAEAVADKIDKVAALHDRLTGQREDSLALIAKQTGSNLGKLGDGTMRLKNADTDKNGYVSKDELVKLMEDNDPSKDDPDKTFNKEEAEKAADEILKHAEHDPSKGLRVRGTLGERAEDVRELMKAPLETLEKSGMSGILAKTAEVAQSSSPVFAPLDAGEEVNSKFEVRDPVTGENVSLEKYIGRPVTKADEWAIKEVAPANEVSGFKPLTPSFVGRALAISDEDHGLAVQYEAERVKPREGADINAFTFHDRRLREGLKEARDNASELGVTRWEGEKGRARGELIKQPEQQSIPPSSDEIVQNAKSAMHDAFQSIRQKLGESAEEATKFMKSVTTSERTKELERAEKERAEKERVEEVARRNKQQAQKIQSERDESLARTKAAMAAKEAETAREELLKGMAEANKRTDEEQELKEKTKRNKQQAQEIQSERDESLARAKTKMAEEDLLKGMAEANRNTDREADERARARAGQAISLKDVTSILSSNAEGFDKDKDGFISKEDAQESLGSYWHPTRVRATRLLDEIDRKGLNKRQLVGAKKEVVKAAEERLLKETRAAQARAKEESMQRDLVETKDHKMSREEAETFVRMLDQPELLQRIKDTGWIFDDHDGSVADANALRRKLASDLVHYDRNNDGYVDMKELATELGKTKANNVMHAFDQNKDGLINVKGEKNVRSAYTEWGPWTPAGQKAENRLLRQLSILPKNPFTKEETVEDRDHKAERAAKRAKSAVDVLHTYRPENIPKGAKGREGAVQLSIREAKRAERLAKDAEQKLFEAGLEPLPKNTLKDVYTHQARMARAPR